MSSTDPGRSDATRGADAGDAADRTDASRDPARTATPADGDTGRHAVSRPAPTPPEPTPVPTGTTPDATAAPEPTTTPPGTAAGTTTGSPAATPGPDDRTGPATDTDTDTDATSPSTRSSDPRSTSSRDELFPDPHAPRTPHALTHVLGTVVGLVLAPFAVALLLLGQSRILAVQADGWDASLELLGIVLVSAGALLAAGLLLLGLWSAAVPVAAGLVVVAVGGLQLYAPGIARTATLDLAGSNAWDLTLKQATVAGTSGTTLTTGLLLLTGGVAVALARRHGIRLGAFRERNRSGAAPATGRSTVREADNQD